MPVTVQEAEHAINRLARSLTFLEQRMAAVETKEARTAARLDVLEEGLRLLTEHELMKTPRAVAVTMPRGTEHESQEIETTGQRFPW